MRRFLRRSLGNYGWALQRALVHRQEALADIDEWQHPVPRTAREPALGECGGRSRAANLDTWIRQQLAHRFPSRLPRILIPRPPARCFAYQHDERSQRLLPIGAFSMVLPIKLAKGFYRLIPLLAQLGNARAY